jgi:uncharacterized protein
MPMLRAFITTMLIWAAGQASAQCSGPSYLDQISKDQRAILDQATADLPFAQGLVWDGRRDDRQITVIGTMHVYDPRLDKIFAAIADDITKADLILLEATPADQDALQTLLANEPDRFLITTGPTLPDLLDPADWAQLAAAASDRGVPGFMAAQMQPWYLSLLLAIPPCAMADLAAGGLGLDGLIADLAQANATPMQALEPYTTLFEIFNAAPVTAQVDMLRLGLAAPAQQEAMFVAMLDAYFAGHVAQIWELSRLAARDMPDIDPDIGAAVFTQMESALLIGRNRNWIPVITAASKNNSHLVAAFGAAHLFGDQGVLQLLENDGWTFTKRF